MACKDANKTVNSGMGGAFFKASDFKISPPIKSETLFFGVDSRVRASELLQNNLTMIEWVRRNKVAPSFWGRNISKENSLTKEEIIFIHQNGCAVSPIYISENEKTSIESGIHDAEEAVKIMRELNISRRVAIFCEISDTELVSMEYLKGYAETLLVNGYTPAFKANTDAAFIFDREFSRGMNHFRGIFELCLVWATEPRPDEYDKITTSHIIHPDNWLPFAPSGITRDDIAVWQYGRNCHPINDNANRKTEFNINLIKNDNVIIKKMI